MRTMLILLLILSILDFYVGAENYDIIKLIGDFIVKMKVPVKVTAFICWPKAEKLLLWKSLSNHGISSKIGKDEMTTNYFHPLEHQLFLLDASCNISKDLLKKGDQLNMFRHPFKWIIWDQSNQKDFKDIYFRLDSQIFVINKEKTFSNEIYRIKSPYKLSKESLGFLKNDLAEWEVSQGFLTYKELSLYENRKNLTGLNLNISFVVTNSETYKHLDDYRNTYIDALTKHNWFTMKVLTSILNTTSTNIFQYTWGYREQNSSRYTGMIGDLQSNKADIGGSASFVTEDRLYIVDFVAPSAPTYIKFIFRAPPLTSVSNVFALPFSLSVWYACFGLITIVLIVVNVIVKWEWQDVAFKEKLEENSVTPLRPGFFNVLVMELGAITQQGTESEPKSNAGRTATIFVFVAFMFLFTSYAANIVAILQSTTDSIKTLEDLLNSRMSCGVEDIPYGHQFFEKAQEPIRKAIFERKVAPKGQKPNFMTMQEGISRVQKGFFAFHVDIFSGYNVISNVFQEDEKCSLKELVYHKHTEPWVSVKKGSVYKELVRVGLMKTIETGLQKRHSNRIFTKKPICSTKSSNFVSVGILDSYAAFLIFGIGSAIAISIFCLEILVYKKTKMAFGNYIYKIA